MTHSSYILADLEVGMIGKEEYMEIKFSCRSGKSIKPDAIWRT